MKSRANEGKMGLANTESLEESYPDFGRPISLFHVHLKILFYDL
jgi:hypothetical protein